MSNNSRWSFDVTGSTRYRQHKTCRRCDTCHHALVDTIVHFGELGSLPWPLNWQAAIDLVDDQCCELVLVLGSSLKILSKYAFLWPTNAQRKTSNRKIVIVNLQKTAKDGIADLKINGKCDDVMRAVMDRLKAPIPEYCAYVSKSKATLSALRKCDPINTTKRRQCHTARIMDRIIACTCDASSSLTPTTCDSPMSVESGSSSLAQTDGAVVVDNKPGWWASGFASVMVSGKKRRKVNGKPGATLRRIARERRRDKAIKLDVDVVLSDLIQRVCDH